MDRLKGNSEDGLAKFRQKFVALQSDAAGRSCRGSL